MKLINYIPEILSVGKANGNVSFDVALNMFNNNVKDVNDPADQYKYKGADHVDYSKLDYKEVEEERVPFEALVKPKLPEILKLIAEGKGDEVPDLFKEETV